MYQCIYVMCITLVEYNWTDSSSFPGIRKLHTCRHIYICVHTLCVYMTYTIYQTMSYCDDVCRLVMIYFSYAQTARGVCLIEMRYVFYAQTVHTHNICTDLCQKIHPWIRNLDNDGKLFGYMK